jgi:hypothetical protein
MKEETTPAEHDKTARKIYEFMEKLREEHTIGVTYCIECFQEWPCPTVLMLDHYQEIMGILTFLRNPVLDFAEEMEKKLRKHDGDKAGWNLENEPHALDDLRLSLREHVFKLDLSILGWPYNHYDRIISNCADVANFAMMIADNAARWRDESKKENSSDEGY